MFEHPTDKACKSKPLRMINPLIEFSRLEKTHLTREELQDA